MSRRQPVAFFLGDVGFLSDPKFRRLARLLTDPDDFNSAVGAYFIVLAASRRNGSPDIDAAAETDSRFIEKLVEVGLLTDGGFPPSWKSWGAMSPQQAAAGHARAEGAKRDDRGHFLPSSSAPAQSSALDNRSSAVQPSFPLPSTPLNERGPGENTPPVTLESARARRVNDRVWANRIERYRQTGEWPEDQYGPLPAELRGVAS